MLVAVLQYGVGGAQSPLELHLLTHVCVVVLQTRLGLPQLASVTQATHCPAATSQYGLPPAAEQSELDAHWAQR